MCQVGQSLLHQVRTHGSAVYVIDQYVKRPRLQGGVPPRARRRPVGHGRAPDGFAVAEQLREDVHELVQVHRRVVPVQAYHVALVGQEVAEGRHELPLRPQSVEEDGLLRRHVERPLRELLVKIRRLVLVEGLVGAGGVVHRAHLPHAFLDRRHDDVVPGGFEIGRGNVAS